MMRLTNILFSLLFIFQDAYEIDWEFEDAEIYNFFLILFGIILLIVILVYVLLSSREEQ
jgi:hypothetical protein